MTHTLEEVRRIASQLPEEERRQLADSLLNSLEPDSELDERWKVEAERRIDALDAGVTETRSWEEVESRLRSRYVR